MSQHIFSTSDAAALINYSGDVAQWNANTQQLTATSGFNFPEPMDPPVGVREPRRPILPSTPAAMALALPDI